MPTSSSESRSHSPWDGKSQGVCIPQGRQKALDGKIRTFVGPVWRALAGHLGQDQVHRLRRMPPQDAVAEVRGARKGTRAIAVARQGGGRPRNWHGEGCWGRGYAVSTVGVAEEQSRASIKPQAQLDAQGVDASGAFSQRGHGPWQP